MAHLSPGLIAAGALGALGCVVCLDSVYLLTLAAAALVAEGPLPSFGSPTSRVTVLVPAHNESGLIARCIRSLAAQNYPPELFEIVVIADNCTDSTAAIAQQAGAMVLIRDDPAARGKGQALRWAMDRVLAVIDPPDAVVVVDADSVAEPELLAALVARLEQGASAVQAEYLMLPDVASTAADLRAAGILLFHRVRSTGRTRLGLPCTLVGNGMLFSRSLLEAHPWAAFSQAEDLEYSVDLRLAGVRPVFAGAGCVRGPMPAQGRAAQVQRQRWEGGRLHVARTRLLQLLAAGIRHPVTGPLDAALDLAVPPLGLLAVAALGGVGLSTALGLAGIIPLVVALPWFGAAGGIALFVVVGLRAGGAPRSMYRSLARAPIFLASKVIGTGQVVRGSGDATWVRTERLTDRSSA